MAGKVCLITGATLGIGEVTAFALARQGATVVIVARSKSRGDATVAEIKSQTGNQSVDLLIADLSSLASIRQVAQEFKSRYSRLDVLINNAGAINMQRTLTGDGLETTFAVNHLAYFLLTNLLLDLLKSSAPSRIINVSSDASKGARIDFNNLQGEKGYSGMGAYSQSKLENVLFTVGLAKRLQGTGVTANTLHPGFVASGFGKNNGPLMKFAMSLAQFIAISPEKGAETQIYLATSPDVANVTGKYFDKKKAVEPNHAAYDDAQVERLWQISEQLTGITTGAAISAAS